MFWPGQAGELTTNTAVEVVLYPVSDGPFLPSPLVAAHRIGNNKHPFFASRNLLEALSLCASSYL